MKYTAFRTFVLISACAGLLLPASGNAAEPRLKWSFETGGKIYASPILVDLNNDGKIEVLVCASRDKRVLALTGEGELLWDYRIDDGEDDGLQATPSAVDYDGDGMKEVFYATKGGIVGCLDARGNPVWRTYLHDKIDYSGPLAADVDGDRRIEIVIGADSGVVYCLDDCGLEKWRYQGDGPVRGIPAYAWDPVTKSAAVFVTFGGGLEAALGGDGKPLWTFNEPGPSKERRSGPAIGLIDPDFAPDVVTATEDFQVIVRDAFSGAEKWRWAGKATADQTNSFALADFEHRNRHDVICADGSGQGGTGHVHRLRDGKALWSADVGGGVVQGPSIGDVDGDGHLEILVCSRSKRLICLDENGKEKWSFPSQTEMLTTPALGDIDGDGKVEIVFTSKDRRIYCVTVDGAYNPGLMPWPMLSHDAQLSGNFYGAPFTPPAMSGPSPIPDLYLPEFGSIHIGNNVIEGQITNNWFRPRRLEAMIAMYLPDGTCINRTVARRFDAVSCQLFKLEFPALFEGDYTLLTSLVDRGQGRTISYQEQKKALDPQADVDIDMARALLGKDELFRDMFTGPARSRLEQACAQADDSWKKGIENLRAVVAKPEATLKERREALAAATQAGKEAKHLHARAAAIRLTPANAGDFGVLTETTLKKVFKDDPILPPYLIGAPKPKEAAISLCGNELEGIQFLVVPALKDLKNLRASLTGDLAQSGGTGKIPTQEVSICRVGYVQIGAPEYNWHVDKLGEHPDVLFPMGSPVTPADVPADQDAQPFFLTVKAQEQTPPGDYTGAVRFEADDCAPVEVPLKVHVWNFHIPAKPHFKVSMWMNEGFLKAFYKYPERTPAEVRKRFYQFHLDHRVSPIQLFPIGGGDMIEDFDYLMANGQNCFFVSVPGWLPESGRPAEAQRLIATRDLLQQKGWNQAALFYSLDEVAVMQRPQIPKMVEMNAWAKTVIPEWPRLETSAPEKALFGAVDVWCPTIDAFDPQILSERMAQGDRLWFYTVWGRPGIMIEFPATDHRLMFWQCFKYGAEGFLYWGTTHWDLNCAGEDRWPQKPWITYNRQPGHNGCGYLIYPGPDGTPLSSIRFEAVRDGIEDYEYLWLLRTLLEEKKDKAPQELSQRARAELGIGPEVLIDRNTFTDNPEYLLKARTRIAELIEAFSAL